MDFLVMFDMVLFDKLYFMGINFQVISMKKDTY